MSSESEFSVQAVVDHDLCAGVAQCLQSAPAGFELDESGMSVFTPAGAWTLAQLNEAADLCPMGAIRILN